LLRIFCLYIHLQFYDFLGMSLVFVLG
jgi:hypothetical protein